MIGAWCWTVGVGRCWTVGVGRVNDGMERVGGGWNGGSKWEQFFIGDVIGYVIGFCLIGFLSGRRLMIVDVVTDFLSGRRLLIVDVGTEWSGCWKRVGGGRRAVK